MSLSLSLSVVPTTAPHGDRSRSARALHPASTSRAHLDLEAIAAGLAATAPDVHLDDGDATRRYSRVLATARYDAWIIRWTTAAELRLHDHGDSAGVVQVVEGELLELRASVARPRRLLSTTVRRGEQLRIRPNTVHAVSNVAAAEALSVHVYSPPLTRMTFYDQRNGMLLATETSPVTYSNALHDVKVDSK